MKRILTFLVSLAMVLNIFSAFELNIAYGEAIVVAITGLIPILGPGSIVVMKK